MTDDIEGSDTLFYRIARIYFSGLRVDLQSVPGCGGAIGKRVLEEIEQILGRSKREVPKEKLGRAFNLWEDIDSLEKLIDRAVWSRAQLVEELAGLKCTEVPTSMMSEVDLPEAVYGCLVQAGEGAQLTVAAMAERLGISKGKAIVALQALEQSKRVERSNSLYADAALWCLSEKEVRNVTERVRKFFENDDPLSLGRAWSTGQVSYHVGASRQDAGEALDKLVSEGYIELDPGSPDCFRRVSAKDRVDKSLYSRVRDKVEGLSVGNDFSNGWLSEALEGSPEDVSTVLGTLSDEGLVRLTLDGRWVRVDPFRDDKSLVLGERIERAIKRAGRDLTATEIALALDLSPSTVRTGCVHLDLAGKLERLNNPNGRGYVWRLKD